MIKTTALFYTHLLKAFPHQPTILQEELFKQFAFFLFSKEKEALFLLKGYAGTGKTTSISTIVNNLWQTGYKAVLLAPTGRAAKVIANYAKKEAFTIHKKIYFPKRVKGGGLSFVLKPNKHTNTIFFVDEASMIPERSGSQANFASFSLLEDLMQYIYGGQNCKLVLIGDTAQLPPVKLALSPALDFDKLTLDYNKEVSAVELIEVMRQQEHSGILKNATLLRNMIADYYKENTFKFDLNQPDVIRLIDGYEIEDAINSSYDNNSVEDTAIIVRSNKRANQYNQQIRLNIRGKESDISSGDFIMVVKNNYYWLEDSSDAGFIANGDTCEILEIFSRKELYGFHFAEAKIRMIDYPNQIPFETVLLLDTLTANTPSLAYEDSNRLYQEIAKDYAHLPKYKAFQSIKENKFFNALQIKFSYAVTCHKAQGGQWKNVFIEKPWLPDGESIDYWRWLYTAITRAQEKVYLLGYTDDDFIN